MGWEGSMTRLTIAAVALVGLAPGGLAAQRGRSQVEEGNRLYREQHFDEAHRQYLDALRAAPGSGVIRFNDGNALYKGTEYEQAVEAYRSAVQSGDPALQERAWYNLGNALFRRQQLEGAAEAYRQALRRDPADQDAKHNLERVLQVKQQKQQQQNNQQQNDQSKDQNQQQQQQQNQSNQQQDQSQREQQGQQQDQPQQQNPEQQQGEQQQGKQQQQPGPKPQMTPEEAEQLLKAIQEDPSKIRRQHKTTTAERKPRKKW